MDELMYIQSYIVFRDPRSNKVVFLRHFDEGTTEKLHNADSNEELLSRQSRAAIDPSGTQNDGEVVEEVDREDEERRIYPSTSEDELDGKSDAEGIDTIKSIEENHLKGFRFGFYSLENGSYIAFRGPQRHSDTIYELPANRGAMICLTLSARCYDFPHVHGLRGNACLFGIKVKILALSSRCVISHMSMDYAGLSMLGD
ncbi:hypothetical protein BJ912DRAFT_1047600 [Pholiota molesta]|nr:hypothetical protein BJ912DRAFT_1047600 [Pholiota molesta]